MGKENKDKNVFERLDDMQRNIDVLVESDKKRTKEEEEQKKKEEKLKKKKEQILNEFLTDSEQKLNERKDYERELERQESIRERKGQYYEDFIKTAEWIYIRGGFGFEKKGLTNIESKKWLRSNVWLIILLLSCIILLLLEFILGVSCDKDFLPYYLIALGISLVCNGIGIRTRMVAIRYAKDRKNAPKQIPYADLKKYRFVRSFYKRLRDDKGVVYRIEQKNKLKYSWIIPFIGDLICGLGTLFFSLLICDTSTIIYVNVVAVVAAIIEIILPYVFMIKSIKSSKFLRPYTLFLLRGNESYVYMKIMHGT